MHILFMAERYPNAQHPLRHTFFHDQVQALRSAGHTVNVICPPNVSETRAILRRVGDVFASCEQYEGVTIYRMHLGWFPWYWPELHSRLLGWCSQRVFEHYCRVHGRPDVIHAHNMRFCGNMAVQIKQKHGIPAVLTEHSSLHLRGFWHPAGLMRRILEQCDHVFTVGPSLVDVVQHYAPDVHPEIIGNMVDSDFFVPGTVPASETPFTFSMVSRLDENKGGDVLLRAFAALVTKTERPVELVIGGDGPQRESLEALTHALKIEAYVKFVGQLSRDAVRSLFQRSQVVVSSSYTETFGITLIEALVCGKPVVTTRSGGPEFFVHDGNGLLVAPGDSDALGAAMYQMLTAYSTYDREAIRAECVRRFSAPAIVQRLVEVYQAVQ